MWKIRTFLITIGFPAALVAQQNSTTSRAAELIALARAQVHANRADSAVTLLKLAVDSATGGSVGEREQGFVLLGILEYVAYHDSSATALAFRRALQLDPDLQAGGLTQVDSTLERIFVAERRALAPDQPRPAAPPPPPAATRDAPTAGSRVIPVHDCVRRCRGGEAKPEVMQRPQLPMLDPAVLGSSATRGVIVVRFIVGVEGAPEPESMRVTTNTAQALTTQVLEALRATQFRPATLNGEAVRAEVEMRFEFRAVGYNTVDYTITGP